MNNNKAKIIEAAEALVFEKGIADTTVTAVAQKAGVADSLVYQYFKNKEDLLFSVVIERMVESIEVAKEALQGIQDPESRLRKLIWHSLKYNDRHPGYVRTLMFECRSNPSFYTTKGYAIMREHLKLLVDILKQGVSEGVFRDDVHLGLVRDLIYGAFDFESIDTIATKEIDESIGDFDAIINLLLPMLRKSTPEAENEKETKILEAAEAMFSEKGFNKTRVQEIARLAKVAEGSIYDYFKNKEDLLLSIPLKRFQRHIDALPETFHIKSPQRKLRRLIKYHFSLYLNNRNFLRVFLLDIQLNKRFYGSKAFDLFQTYLKAFEGIIAEGKAEGCFRRDINPRVFRNMFLGAFSHMALRWLFFNEENKYDKLEEIDSLTDLLSFAVINHSGRQS
ncbi:MAG: TetR/AcrR family transcriptional regulator [Thermodesulfobacteriota bacterium]